MPDRFADFRSDTLTQPTPEMRAAMAEAPLGDDVYGEDPTINALEERVAALLGKEAALFVPSGTMSNQIAIRTHTSPGDEMLCEAECHVYYYEQGGFVQLSGVTPRPIQGEYGVLRPEQLEDMIQPDNDHFVRTRLVTLENTHNRGAGRVQPYEAVEGVCRWAHEHGLVTHLDGARLMNAVVASGIAADQWARHFDSVSLCFSKGLGAPVGSALAGERDWIRAARRNRKLLGGGMRQAGVLAAGALYALEHHVERLAVDHAHARQLAEAIRPLPGLRLAPPEIHTNMVVFEVAPQLGTAAELVARLKARGVLMLATGPRRVRAVTHLDLTAADIDRAAAALAELTEGAA
jgi:threonine aldolase